MSISCFCDSNLDKPDFKNIQETASLVFSSQNISDYDISVIFVKDDYLSKLKKKYLNLDHLTDVLAFRLNGMKEKNVDGEIYISLDRAKENAKTYKEPFEKEVSRLIIHGCLHLIGFDDQTNREKVLMTKMENDYLKVANWEDTFGI